MSDQASNPEREISRGMVGIYKEYFGRGPTSARSAITPTHVTVILEDALTVVERRLASEGNNETVETLRENVQQVMRDDMVTLAERVTGRKVRCLLSDHDVPTDTAAEVLVFERENGNPTPTDGEEQVPSPS
jgi:uncharacterized protein YbcI